MHYTASLNLNPSDALVLGNRAAAYEMLGQYQAAVDDATRALQLDSTYLKGYFRLATAHLALGNPEEALAAAAEGLRRQPSNSQLCVLREQAQEAMEEEAVEEDEGDDDDDDDDDDGDDGDDDGEEEERAAIDSGEEDGDVSEGSESEEHESPPVMSLTCRQCHARLTERGMEVFLVANPASSLFSTDIPTDNLCEGEPKPIPSCACVAVSVLCCHCSQTVGYHVTRPCDLCSLGGHNGHFVSDGVGVRLKGSGSESGLG